MATLVTVAKRTCRRLAATASWAGAAEEARADGRREASSTVAGGLSGAELRELMVAAHQPTPESRAELLHRVQPSLDVHEKAQGSGATLLELRHPQRDAPLALLTRQVLHSLGTFSISFPLSKGAELTVTASILQPHCIPRQGTLLHNCFVHHTLPVVAASPLVAHALASVRGARVNALVGLPGMSEWVVEGERWRDAAVLDTYGEEAREAAKAVALGRPRPGHRVLGAGTFQAAANMWVELARQYVAVCEETAGCGTVGERERVWEEVEMWCAMGARVEGPAHMADMSEERLRSSGGALLHMILEPKA